MEVWFFHPDRGAWCAITPPDADMLAGYPEGTQQIEPPPALGWTWNGAAWVEPPAPDPVEALAAERAAMTCTTLQARLVLGEAMCATLDAMRADNATPWRVRELLTWATQWDRTAPEIDQIGQILGLTPEQIDDLFRTAMGGP